MNQYERTIEWSATTAGEEASSAIATRAAGKVVGKVVGGVVQPVVWLAKGSAPEKIDVGLWLLSLGSRFISIPAAGVGLLKALVDDATLEQLKEVRRDEPQCFADCIRPTLDYSSFAGSRINAMTIASNGGTAWRHPNGLWVHLLNPDSEELYIYNPCKWTELYTPVLPLKKRRTGYQWTARRK